jgi:hypothetical protein
MTPNGQIANPLDKAANRELFLSYYFLSGGFYPCQATGMRVERCYGPLARQSLRRSHPRNDEPFNRLRSELTKIEVPQ